MTEKSPLYKDKYGAWAGDPQGRAPNYMRCCENVYSRERWGRFYQCTRPRGHGPDGAYCKQHDPAAKLKRADLRRAALDELTAEAERMGFYK